MQEFQVYIPMLCLENGQKLINFFQELAGLYLLTVIHQTSQGLIYEIVII